MAKALDTFPIGAEFSAPSVLFTAEQLTEHARLLAVEHRTEISAGANGLLARLDENERLLAEYNLATYAADQARRITPASEWILDNFYLIEEQIQICLLYTSRCV